MIPVNLKTGVCILGGTATVTALIASAIKHFRRRDDTEKEDTPQEQSVETVDGLSCMDELMEASSLNEENPCVTDTVLSDADAGSHYCYTPCSHSSCPYEKSGVSLRRTNGYTLTGLDPAGRSPHYYARLIRSLRIRLNDACRQINGGELRYAIYDARTVMDETLRMVVNHSDGTAKTEQTMIDNLTACENRHLIHGSKDFFNRLHRIRIMGNANGHRLDAEKKETGNKVCSAIMTIHELLNKAEAVLVPTYEED